MVLRGNLIPVISESIINEYGEVLRRKKFGFPEESISALIDEIKQNAIEADPVQTDEELPDNKDLPFYKAVLSSEKNILITGNIKHFPVHERIMTARKFIDLIKQLQN